MKLVYFALLLFVAGTFEAVHADMFVCQDQWGNQSLVEPDLSQSDVIVGNYVDCIRQDDVDAKEESLLQVVAYRQRRNSFRGWGGRGGECFSFRCRDCSHGSTTNGFPLLFGRCL